jgi:hypothetical protein
VAVKVRHPGIEARAPTSRPRRPVASWRR